MIWARKLSESVERFLQGIRDNIAEVKANDPVREVLGATITAVGDTLAFSYFTGIMALDLARLWQHSNGQGFFTLPVIANALPMRCLLTIGTVALWIYSFARWFRYIGWPRWWAAPYVVLVLCPWTWVLAYPDGPLPRPMWALPSPKFRPIIWRGSVCAVDSRLAPVL